MPVKLKIDGKKYLTEVFGSFLAEKIAENFQFEYFLYGVKVWSVTTTDAEAETVNTGVSTSNIVKGTESSINLNMVSNRIMKALTKIDADLVLSFSDLEMVAESIAEADDEMVFPVGSMTEMKPIGKFMVPFEVYSKIAAHLANNNKVLAIKTLRIQVDCSLVEAKIAVEVLENMLKAVAPIPAPMPGKMTQHVEKAESQVKVEAAPKAKVLTQKVKLVDATAIGQPVHGTSTSSTYYCVALSPTIKVAIRVQADNSFSIRIEGEPTPDEIAAMKSLGVTNSADSHWSAHFGLANVPPERVAGAFLMSLGTEFTAQVQNAKQLKEAIKC